MSAPALAAGLALHAGPVPAACRISSRERLGHNKVDEGVLSPAQAQFFSISGAVEHAHAQLSVAACSRLPFKKRLRQRVLFISGLELSFCQLYFKRIHRSLESGANFVLALALARHALETATRRHASEHQHEQQHAPPCTGGPRCHLPRRHAVVCCNKVRSSQRKDQFFCESVTDFCLTFVAFLKKVTKIRSD
jgi:hypothetical protein